MNIEEIRGGESDRLEFKQALTKDDGKWLKTVVAFANGRGGRILFGITPDLKVTGMGDDLFGAKDSIADAMANRIRPFPPASVEVTTLEGKPIIVVDVSQGMQCPYCLKSKGETDGVYIRYDATTRPADEAILKELRLAGAGKSFDKTECRGISVSERDIAKLCQAMGRTARRNAKTDEQRRNVQPVTRAQLVKWGILLDRGGEFVPTWAYALLSGHEVFSPQVKCAVFKGTDRTFFADRREFSGPVQEQAEKAVRYVLEKINLGARFNGVWREDVYEIPPDAIREIVVNAIVHRSYINGEASPVTVALYDDRLEVTSPGGLPRGMTLAKMLGGYSECRNQALAAAFAYMNLIENWGSGMKRVVGELKAAGLRQPELIEWPNALRVNIFRNAMESAGKGRQPKAARTVGRPKNRPLKRPKNRPLKEVLLEAIRERPGVSRLQLMELSKRGRTMVTETLSVLRDEGKIEYRGSKRLGGYHAILTGVDEVAGD